MLAYCHPPGSFTGYTGEFNSARTLVSLKYGTDLRCPLMQDHFWYWSNVPGHAVILFFHLRTTCGETFICQVMSVPVSGQQPGK